MKRMLTLAIFAISFWSAFAQDRKTGEIIAQLAANTTPQQAIAAITKSNRSAAQITWKSAPAPSWNIHLFAFDEGVIDAEAMLATFRRSTLINGAQFNFKVEERDIEPNDPSFPQQWDMKLIGAPNAWDAGTGGVTKQGDTIVVAVLEKGALTTHLDLINNHWYNWAEIPDNNKDDDGNGYIDDFRGWDARAGGDGNGNGGSHGTGVNGIIGAKGNNTLGVSGVNWDVKLLNISNTEYVAEIIAAYEYCGKARRLYNQTGGQKGSFIIATNASFGLNNQFPADQPLWCAVYDSIGKVGIISVGATTNQNSDVDVVGDMPTTCPSNYFVAVTNVDNTDKKAPSAGYGAINIDLGAPGTGTYTTALNNGYATLGGTSAATPHVTGSIALLYNIACASFTADALTSPATCARRMRELLLNSVQPNQSLQGLTASGGRLDLSNALDTMQVLCGGTVGPMAIEQITPNPTQGGTVTIRYQTPDNEQYNLRVYNMLGQLMLEKPVVPQQYSLKIIEFESWIFPVGVYSVTFGKGKNIVSTKILKI